MDRPLSHPPYLLILEAWGELEAALREALPPCSLAPPTQPAELLAALRITNRISPEEEERIRTLRTLRNRAAHDPEEPAPEAAAAFREEVAALVAHLRGTP